MKPFHLLVLFLLFAGCESSRTASIVQQNQQEALIRSHITLKVNGLGCPLCASNLDRQLQKLPGVREVKVDLGTGRVSVAVEGNKRPTRAQWTKAVTDGGFTLVDVDESGAAP